MKEKQQFANFQTSRSVNQKAWLLNNEATCYPS